MGVSKTKEDQCKMKHNYFIESLNVVSRKGPPCHLVRPPARLAFIMPHLSLL